MLQETVFKHEDHLEVAHDPAYQLSQGTFSLRFTANDVVRKQGLFSKDYTGNRNDGDLTAFVERGRVSVRFQSATGEVWAKTPAVPLANRPFLE